MWGYFKNYNSHWVFCCKKKMLSKLQLVPEGAGEGLKIIFMSWSCYHPHNLYSPFLVYYWLTLIIIHPIHVENFTQLLMIIFTSFLDITFVRDNNQFLGANFYLKNYEKHWVNLKLEIKYVLTFPCSLISFIYLLLKKHSEPLA